MSKSPNTPGLRVVALHAGPRSYDIVIGPNAAADLAATIATHRAARVAVIADARVAALHGPALRAQLPADALWIEFPAGEPSKSLACAGMMYDALAEARFPRDGLILAFGGGVAGDLGGFVAATWMRGVAVIQVPTTLEAAIDASIGGKTAVNHPRGKNLIGAFHQPRRVIVDTGFLATVSERDFAAGLAESVKHALIADESFLQWHERHAEGIVAREPALLVELIERNCRIKADVVTRDERETGVRIVLNYGHTIGHAVENLAGYGLRHGECIALGMLAALDLGAQRARTPRSLLERVRALLVRLGLPVRLPGEFEADAVWELCRGDKKTADGRVRFVLLDAVGRPVTVDDVTPVEVAAALKVIAPVGSLSS